MQTRTSSRPIRNALALLEALGADQGPHSLSDLSRRCQVPKATALRYVRALEEAGYAERDPQTSGYWLGHKIVQLRQLYFAQNGVISAARRALRPLADETGETSHLGVLNLPDVVYIDTAEGPQRIRAYILPGERLPAYCVASGHSILAHSAPDVVKQVVAAGMPPRTANTLVDEAGLLGVLESVRRQGYAITSGQWREDVVGISAPLFDVSGRVVGALGVSCPQSRSSKANIKNFARIVCEYAQAVSSQSSHKGGHDV